MSLQDFEQVGCVCVPGESLCQHHSELAPEAYQMIAHLKEQSVNLRDALQHICKMAERALAHPEDLRPYMAGIHERARIAVAQTEHP